MINMKDLIKKQGDMIRKESGMKVVDEANVSSQPYKAWSEHGDNIEKLFRDAHWAVKAFPNKKKEARNIQKHAHKLMDLIAIIKGQAVDL